MRNERIRVFQTTKQEGKYVIYWMQASQRVYFNHALDTAIQIANEKELPLVVYFGLTKNFPHANERHYRFMLEGIKEVEDTLTSLGINFFIKLDSPERGIESLLYDADTVVMDFGYTNIQKVWRKQIIQLVKEEHSCGLLMVESDLVVPIKEASEKVEYAARTIRPKIMKQYEGYLDINGDVEEIKVNSLDLFESKYNAEACLENLSSFNIDHSVKPTGHYIGGYSEALNHLERYLDEVIYQDKEISSDPSLDATSKLSMYLHFGQISPIEIILRTKLRTVTSDQIRENIDRFFEQVIVRRELAFNYVYYTKHYDQFGGMTDEWAYKTMHDHELDDREYIYTVKDYEAFDTHDAYFNAAMREMVKTGYMHNYMRMYWAKKIIEWSETYEVAYENIQYLNDKYFIDGRDPNSYTGIAWCFGKHDRAWTERAVFGKLRYMNANGLKRKYDIDSYVKKMFQL